MKTIILFSTIRWMLSLGLQPHVEILLANAQMKSTSDGLEYFVIEKK